MLVNQCQSFFAQFVAVLSMSFPNHFQVHYNYSKVVP